MIEILPALERVAGFLFGLADHDRNAGSDLQIVRPTSELADPLLQIAVERLGAIEIAARSEHHLGVFGGEIPAGIGRAGLDADRPARRWASDVGAPVDGQ